MTLFITDMIDQKRRFRRYKARKEQLPANYRKVLDAVERYFWHFASGKGESILQLLDDVADLFEQAAADATPVRDIVGADPVEFAEELMRNYPESLWINKERERLAQTINSIAGDHGTSGDGRS
ncbi:hypothetical protein ACU18_08135 [Arthrobacter sp. ZBG10]|jgi:DNA-binding ferritin-like protein (Dps family)|uniref:DUF1048 domain-containing protein n=1 Tax=unclassified Arthrobacter TaxID=235627 RepID=UPI0006804AA4|nr:MULTISPECIES: DUF1048 domain-containing protein [unclassified Arthrobacter]KNH18303.1 hypothetical protein ACU18_08135 [Arthrobacter sp. ZBG10]KQR01215.1 hypothetical protein ASF72_13420 [Arthrobacter sp. Leaf141]